MARLPVGSSAAVVSAGGVSLTLVVRADSPRARALVTR
jgi:hypothetical protein